MEKPGSLRKDNVGALSVGAFIIIILSLAIGLAFFTVVPDFTEDAAASLDTTTGVEGADINATTVTILRLIPFVLGTLFIAFPVGWLVREFRNM